MYIVYSEERDSWNVITDDGEWYFEGTFEECCEMTCPTDVNNYYDNYDCDEEM